MKQPVRSLANIVRRKNPGSLQKFLILNRLKSQAEKVIAEEQASFRAERSTTKQIFNLGILCEKYISHQQDHYHVFIDFEKAYDRVCHATLLATMEEYNSANLIQVIKIL